MSSHCASVGYRQQQCPVPRLQLETLGLSLRESKTVHPESVAHQGPSPAKPALPKPQFQSRTGSAPPACSNPWARPRVAPQDHAQALPQATEAAKSFPLPEHVGPDFHELLSSVRSQLSTLGPRCSIELVSVYTARAAAGKDAIDPASAVHVLRSNRFRLSDTQCSALFTPYTEGGKVRMGPLMRDLIGTLGERRRHLVQQIFEKLDCNSDGLLTPGDVRRGLRIAHHPLVVTGQATLDQVHAGFLARAMDPKGEPVTLEQFEVYHAALSTAFRRDEDFAAWLAKFWRV